MARKLLLTSKGLPYVLESEEGLGRNFSRLFPSPEGMPLAFVTTAADVMERQDYVRSTRARLEELGFCVEDVDLKGRTQSSLEGTLRDTKVIYMIGGQAFYLLDHIRRSGFDKLAGPLLDSGVIYLGPSAGAYVACPNIEMARWKLGRDSRGLGDLTALGLVPFLVTAHFSEAVRSDVEVGARSTSLPVVVLTDEQGIFVEGETTGFWALGVVRFSTERKGFLRDRSLVSVEYNFSVRKDDKSAG